MYSAEDEKLQNVDAAPTPSESSPTVGSVSAQREELWRLVLPPYTILFPRAGKQL